MGILMNGRKKLLLYLRGIQRGGYRTIKLLRGKIYQWIHSRSHANGKERF